MIRTFRWKTKIAVTLLASAILAASAALSGCGSQKQDAAAEDGTEATENSASAGSDPAESGETEERPDTASADLTDQENDQAVSAEENRLVSDTADNLVRLAEEADLTLDLAIARDPEDGTLLYQLLVQNPSEATLYFSLDGITVNQEIRLQNSAGGILEAGETDTETLYELADTLRILDVEELSLLEADLEITNWDTQETLYTGKIRRELHATGNQGMYCIPILDAKADRQVLLENETVRVTLLGCGRYIAALASNRLSGTVLFENLSDGKIPVGVCGLSLNGQTVDTNTAGTYLEAGCSLFRDFDIYVDDDFREETGITSISSMSLLVLTDPDEVSGTVTMQGGSWYEVELSASGETEDWTPEGELLLDEADVEIWYRGQKRTEYYGGEGGLYKWEITILNNGDENIEIDAADVLLNGEADDSKNLYVSDAQVGAHSRTNAELHLAYETGEVRPDISFRFRIRSLGGGEILKTGEQTVTLEAEDEKD